MLFGNMNIKDNELHIGTHSASSLVKEYGSPLYVYDKGLVIDTINRFKENFTSTKFKTTIAYASKAFLVSKFVKLLQKEQLSLDCVSGGELYMAYKSGFNMANVYFHGNNKSRKELELALSLGVGTIIVDNKSELEVLIELTNERKQYVNTLLRVNPGVSAHTHEYIVTATHSSKFGESIYDKEQFRFVIGLFKSSEYISFNGLHAHIGSQIFDDTPFYDEVRILCDFYKEVEEEYGIVFDTLNIGGGFGVYYTEEDTPKEIGSFMRNVISHLEENISKYNLNINNVIIEPGRSIISNAGLTLYEVGYHKVTYDKKEYVFIDGGMSDNIRPALYQAKYDCDIATNMNGTKAGNYTIAGKLCESGDVLIRDTALQPFKQGDLLAIYTTGAYNYTMSSNYNLMGRPGVVFVGDEVEEFVKKETYEDLFR